MWGPREGPRRPPLPRARQAGAAQGLLEDGADAGATDPDHEWEPFPRPLLVCKGRGSWPPTGSGGDPPPKDGRYRWPLVPTARRSPCRNPLGSVRVGRRPQGAWARGVLRGGNGERPSPRNEWRPACPTFPTLLLSEAKAVLPSRAPPPLCGASPAELSAVATLPCRWMKTELGAFLGHETHKSVKNSSPSGCDDAVAVAGST